MATKTKKHRRTQFDRAEAPLYSIRVRHNRGSKGNKTVRVIKVRSAGTKSGRWIQYARFVWEQAHGPVPADRQVLHRDGNLMNDNLSNLFLGTPADKVALFHTMNPRGSAENYAKCRKATARHNVERARFYRSFRWTKGWYAVMPVVGQVLNCPRKKRTIVAREMGIEADWRTCRSAMMGFPNRNLMAACVLAVMRSMDPIRSRDLVHAVQSLRQLAGWEPGTRGAIYSAVSALRVDGFIAGGREHYLTGLHELEESRRSPLLIVRGDRLASEKCFESYRKVERFEGVCKLCGCTEEYGCCFWIEQDLCSACTDRTFDSGVK